jgi:hypothetical protein
MPESIQIKIECQCGEIIPIAAHYIDSDGVVVYMLAPHTCYPTPREDES